MNVVAKKTVTVPDICRDFKKNVLSMAGIQNDRKMEFLYSLHIQSVAQNCYRYPPADGEAILSFFNRALMIVYVQLI